MLSSLERKLDVLDIGVDAKRWVVVSFLLSAMVFFLSETLIGDIVLSVLLLMATFSASLYLPDVLLRVKERKLVEDFPGFLLSLTTLVSGGVPFREALLIASRGRELERYAVSAYNSEHPLRHLRERLSPFPSLQKMVDMVSRVYRGEYEVVRKVAEDTLRGRVYRAREYSARASVTSLVFISLTALLPSMLIVYDVLTSLVFGGTGVSDIILVIPLLALIVMRMVV